MMCQATRRMRTRSRVVSLLAFTLTIVASHAHGAAPLTPPTAAAVQFSPRGVVKNVRQATARFPQPMVRLGDPRPAADPLEIDCAEKGTSRWLDSRTWAFDFARELPAGVRCTFRLRAGVKTLAGAPVVAPEPFELSTGGPAIVRTLPFEGAQDVAEDQAFVLVLDADPDPASLLAHVAFAVDGVGERVGVRLVDGAERDAIAKEYAWVAKPPFVVVQATQRFPNGARVALVWGAGVATTSGVATAAD